MKILKTLKTIIFHRPIKNLFRRKYKKKVLISYIVHPFRKGISFFHTNEQEVLKIAEVFDELGYVVDIYHYLYPIKPNFSEYSVIFGMGPLFEDAVKNKNSKTIYIYYATGSHFCYQNNAELRRIKQLYKRKKILISPKRFAEHSYYSYHLSDAIIVLGNDFTASTIRAFSNTPIYKLNASVYNLEELNKIERNIKLAKKNFLWFGSYGLVHKGLDICIDVFKQLPHLNLHICSPWEQDFFSVYEQELKLHNIFYHGFVNIKSKKFKNIIKNCLFIIFPSCSEGQSTSVLTAMGVGLIPVVTKNVGIDIENKGFLINEDIEDIKNKIMYIVNLDDKTLNKLSQENISYISKYHNINYFKISLQNILKEILKKK